MSTTEPRSCIPPTLDANQILALELWRNIVFQDNSQTDGFLLACRDLCALKKDTDRKDFAALLSAVKKFDADALDQEFQRFKSVSQLAEFRPHGVSIWYQVFLDCLFDSWKEPEDASVEPSQPDQISQPLQSAEASETSQSDQTYADQCRWFAAGLFILHPVADWDTIEPPVNFSRLGFLCEMTEEHFGQRVPAASMTAMLRFIFHAADRVPKVEKRNVAGFSALVLLACARGWKEPLLQVITKPVYRTMLHLADFPNDPDHDAEDQQTIDDQNADEELKQWRHSKMLLLGSALLASYPMPRDALVGDEDDPETDFGDPESLADDIGTHLLSGPSPTAKSNYVHNLEIQVLKNSAVLDNMCTELEIFNSDYSVGRLAKLASKTLVQRTIASHLPPAARAQAVLDITDRFATAADEMQQDYVRFQAENAKDVSALHARYPADHFRNLSELARLPTECAAYKIIPFVHREEPPSNSTATKRK